MIHIVFQQYDVNALKKAFELDESMEGEVVQIADDYAVGPIYNIYSEGGILARKRWWQQVLSGTQYEDELNSEDNDHRKVQFIRDRLLANDTEVVWIWAAQNQHDVSGYYWLVSQLKDFCGRIYILYLNNLPFINEKGNIFYPVNLFQIPPKEFIKAKKLARTVTLSEFEVDPDEWTRLGNEQKGVRLLEGGKKLVQADYDYFDKELSKFITNDWQKAGRIIHHFLNKAQPKTGDAYLLWRLKMLLTTDEFDVQGEPKGFKDFEVKLKVPFAQKEEIQS